jgi:tetratricopeptide (TPR) repeat protein
MKNRLWIVFAVVALLSVELNAQVTMPAPSPTQSIRQDFGLGRVELTYSRPSIKGRKVFGTNSELAPLGKLWRTGANASTKLRFTDNVSVGGKSLDTGTYVLYTIPNKDSWVIILNKGLTNSGADGYKETEDVVRFNAPVVANRNHTESFTIQFADVKNESLNLQLMWGNTLVNVPVTTNIKDRLRTQLEAALKTERKPFQQAATFYYEWDKNYTKALENVNKGIEANPKSFPLYLLKARIEKDMGNSAAAKASVNKTVELATEAKNADYVRMANELLQKK